MSRIFTKVEATKLIVDFAKLNKITSFDNHLNKYGDYNCNIFTSFKSNKFGLVSIALYKEGYIVVIRAKSKYNVVKYTLETKQIERLLKLESLFDSVTYIDFSTYTKKKRLTN